LRRRRPPLVVAVALANKTARAVMLREKEYQPRAMAAGMTAFDAVGEARSRCGHAGTYAHADHAAAPTRSRSPVWHPHSRPRAREGGHLLLLRAGSRNHWRALIRVLALLEQVGGPRPERPRPRSHPALNGPILPPRPLHARDRPHPSDTRSGRCGHRSSPASGTYRGTPRRWPARSAQWPAKLLASGGVEQDNIRLRCLSHASRPMFCPIVRTCFGARGIDRGVNPRCDDRNVGGTQRLPKRQVTCLRRDIYAH
jgi:hypothetical protein